VPTTAPVAAPSSTAAAGGQVWSIASGSEAGYRVKETLFGQSATAVGRTSAITGSIRISGSQVTAGSFTVDMTQVSSDRSQRDGQFRGRIMDTSTNPTSTFTLTKPIDLGTLPPDGTQVTATATGDLTLHGVTHSETFQVTAQRSNGVVDVTGDIPITFSDWNIDNPSGGPASVGDTGTLEFLLHLSAS
jgi:polyisoprenoid-binding protein YceI